MAGVQKQILALQSAQLRHDERYHKDIWLLTVADRMKHYTLHLAKYVGYLAAALNENAPGRVERTLVDAFIISLASANTLALDLGAILTENTPERADGLSSLGHLFAHEAADKGDRTFQFLVQLAENTGLLAKACESLDHIEDYPFRKVMRDGVVRSTKLILAEASVRQLNLPELTRDRWREVESKHLFHSFDNLN